MTEAPFGLSSGSCQTARGCTGPISPNIDGAADPQPPDSAPPGAKQNGLPCHTQKTSGPGSTGPAPIGPAPIGHGCTEEDKLMTYKRKCGCARTSDKVKEILQTFPHASPPEPLQTYMAKKYDKASGFSYGQPDRHGCRSCNKPIETELSASAGAQIAYSGSAIDPVKDRMDSCSRCILHRRKLRETANDEKQSVKEKHYCSTCNKPKDLKEAPVERKASINAKGNNGYPSLPVKDKIMSGKEKQYGIKDLAEKDKIMSGKEKQYGIKDLAELVERSAHAGVKSKDGYSSLLVTDKITNATDKFLCTSCIKPKDLKEVPMEYSVSAGGKGCYSSVPGNDKTMSCGGKTTSSRSWQIVSELVSLVQLSVTATALALYYLIYCYMQLVYYTLRSALYFHNADGPMKITIGVVTLTSLIVGFNILMRMEGIIGIVY